LLKAEHRGSTRIGFVRQALSSSDAEHSWSTNRMRPIAYRLDRAIKSASAASSSAGRTISKVPACAFMLIRL
jgi:hypothetical protein